MNNSVRLARTVVAELLALGIEHVVLSPGSRNAPLSIALARAAAADQLTLSVRIDERSAGFVALGLTKATGRPVAVVTTSGTAVGNLMPAVMEARHAGLPLVVISADRPAEMVGTGANQTADQANLFGRQVRAAARLSSESGSAAAWAAAVARTVTTAGGVRTRDPGPVQLNLEFSAPLLPAGTTDPDPASPDEPPAPKSRELTLSPAGDAGGMIGLDDRRTVVLVGDATPEQGSRARALAESAGLPLFAEPSSNARGGDNAISCYRVLLGIDDLSERIERVIQIGHPTLSRAVTGLLTRVDVEVVVVSDRAPWHDTGHRASHVTDGVVPARGDEHWLNQWRLADHRLRIQLERSARDRDPGGGWELADLVTRQVTTGQHLVFGASNPIRDADLAAISARPATTWSNRGLSGIDGTISTAVGIQLATKQPTTALVGDITFLHDVGGLWLGDLETRPALRVVVADDRGGSIFHGLEQGAARYADSFEKVFGTPHQVDITAVAAGYGWQVQQVTDLEELGRRLRLAPRGPEVLVSRIQRSGRRELDRLLNQL